MNDADPALSLQGEASLQQKLTDPVRIRSVLEDLRGKRTLLSARPQHAEDYFNTALFGFEPQSGDLYLDELSPPDGHRLLAVGDTLHIYGVHKGLPIHFACTVDHIGEQEGIACYRAPLPKAMEYQQERDHFRAHLGMAMELSVRLRLQDGERISGHLQDISLGGLAALLPAHSPVSQGDPVIVEYLQLPGEAPVTCTAQIRHVHPSQGRLHAGLHFINLTPRVERGLMRAILRLERERIRRQPKE